MKRLAMVLLATILVVSLVLGVACARPEGKPSPKMLIMGDSFPGGWMFSLATGVAAVWNESLEDIRVSVEPSGGGFAWFPAMREGKIMLGFASCYDAEAATRGIREMQGQKECKIRTMALGGETQFCYIIHPKSGINSLKELKGKRIYAYYPAMGAPNYIFQYTLEWLGLKKEDVTVLTVASAEDAAAGLIAGKADAWIFCPAAVMQEIKRTIGLKVLPIPPELAKYICERMVAEHPTIISAKRWPVDEDVPTIGHAAFVAAHEDLDPDTVYRLMKCLYENFQKFQKVHPFAADFALDKMGCDAKIVAVPWHRGAITYLKEKNLWTAVHENLQKELLGKLAK